MPEPVTATRQWTGPLALVIALLAAAAAAWAVLRPLPAPGAAAPSSDPKAQVCEAFGTVSQAVARQTQRDPAPDLGPVVPVAAEAIAANARLAMAGGAAYLINRLPSNAPEEIAAEVRGFAADLDAIAMNALAGISNDTEPQVGLLRSAEQANTRLTELCR